MKANVYCPECHKNIGALKGTDSRRILILNIDSIDEVNSLFDCPHCYQTFKIELTFTKEITTEKITDIGVGIDE